MFYSSSSFYTEDDNPNSSNVNQLTLDLEKDRVISDDVYISLDDNMSVSCMIQLFQLDSVGETDAKPTLARSLSTKAGVCKEPMIVAGTAEVSDAMRFCFVFFLSKADCFAGSRDCCLFRFVPPQIQIRPQSYMHSFVQTR